MLKRSMLVLTLAGFALAGAAFAQQEKTPVSPSPVKRTIVGKIEVPNSNYDVITAVVEIAPGFKAGRHFHPGIVRQILTANSGSRATASRRRSTKRARTSNCR